MKVVLAGYNVDREALDEVRAAAPPRLDLTPETLSAAYARISRDARPVHELRRAARAEVEKARRSNQTIIFKMGHHSVAEHAVFNLDLLGLSRLAIEAVERFRLSSFTEKSQRYILLGDDYVIPGEIGRAGCRGLFVRTVKAQNGLYHRLYGKLLPLALARRPGLAADLQGRALLEGWAKEDARYAVSLATEGQLGLTVNARNLELMIRRFAADPLAEVRELGRMIHDRVKDVAPSILLFTEATAHDAGTYAAVGRVAAGRRPVRAGEPEAPAQAKRPGGTAAGTAVRLVAASGDGDERVLTALLHKVSGRSFASVRRSVARSSPGRRREIFRSAFERMEFHDAPLREFEHADLTFEITLSASAFAQLKRHRMATLTVQDYDPSLGITVPPSVEEAGAGEAFLDMIERTNAAYAVLRGAAGPSAAYVLTNAHRRRVLLKVNLRELYHFARLREDGAAQWDIRAIAARMTRLARRAMPLAGLLLGGKDDYPALYERVFGRPPGTRPPEIPK